MDEDEHTDIELIGGSRMGPSRDGPRRSPVATAALLVVLVAAGLVTVAVLVGQSGSDEEASAPDDAPPDDSDDPDETDDSDQTDGEPEAPDLGGDSDPTEEYGEYGRPLEVSPDSGLVDDQVLTVAGTDFPGNNFIGVAVCGADVLDAHGSGSDHCDPMMLGTTSTTGSGSFDTEVRVPRVVHLGNGEWIDCASAPPAGRATTCVVAAGPSWESGRGGFADLHFATADTDPIRPPALVVEPTAGLVDGQEIVVRVTNADSFEMVEAGLCTRDDMDHAVCHWFPAHEWNLVELDGASAWELRSAVPRWLTTPDDQQFDCADDDISCTLSVAAERWPLAPVTLEFDLIG